MNNTNPILFRSSKAKEYAELNNISLDDFKDDKIEKVGKSDVEKKIKEKTRKKALTIKRNMCECCEHVWETRQAYQKHLSSNASLLYFAKKEIKEKEKINCKLSNEISVLDCKNKTLNSLIEEKDKIITQKDLIILKYQKEKCL